MAKINTAIRSGIDWVALSTYLALVLIGWLMIYSSNAEAVAGESLFSFADLFSGHFMWILISLFAVLCTLFIDWKFWDTFSYVFYVVGILLLIGVLFFGVERKSAVSWYSIFGLSFQPAEVAKFFTSLAIASFLSSYKTNLGKLKTQLSAIGLFLLPSVLILMQPDLGSALVFFSFFIVLYRVGISPMYFIIGFSLVGIFIFSRILGPMQVLLLLLGIGTSVLAFNFKSRTLWIILISLAVILSIAFVPASEFIYVIAAGIALLFLVIFLQWDSRKLSTYVFIFLVILVASLFSFGTDFAFENILKPHQQERVDAWLKPKSASLYNVVQSKLAIGSGGIQGKGFLQGDMTKLNYVPEKSSDFIFSIIGEEQGFLGVVSVVILFTLLLYRIVIIGERAKSNFVRNYAYGVAGIIFFHYFFNIGMAMGIMPVVGIPLPFLSQGGSSLLAFSLMIGVLLKMDLSR